MLVIDLRAAIYIKLVLQARFHQLDSQEYVIFDDRVVCYDFGVSGTAGVGCVE